jgi:hypothetical protein
MCAGGPPYSIIEKSSVRRLDTVGSCQNNKIPLIRNRSILFSSRSSYRPENGPFSALDAPTGVLTEPRVGLESGLWRTKEMSKPVQRG